MTERAALPLAKAYLLLNHGPTVLVSSAHDDRRNVMAAAWSMPLQVLQMRLVVRVEIRCGNCGLLLHLAVTSRLS